MIKIGPFTLPDTKQEMFDFALAKIVEQGEPSVSGGTCAYRKDDDPSSAIRCAAGHFILDKDYTSGMEGNTASDIAPYDETTGLLDDFQECHDHAWHDEPGVYHTGEAFVERFKANMKHLAVRHGLVYKEEVPNPAVGLLLHGF